VGNDAVLTQHLLESLTDYERRCVACSRPAACSRHAPPLGERLLVLERALGRTPWAGVQVAAALQLPLCHRGDRRFAFKRAAAVVAAGSKDVKNCPVPRAALVIFHANAGEDLVTASKAVAGVRPWARGHVSPPALIIDFKLSWLTG
jgi:hypothetical protein